MIKYSVVVPAYNEEENVGKLHQEVTEVLRALGGEFEIIFVNDGSTDNTLQELQKLSPVTIINFRKNYGQTAALDAGIKQAQGEIIITMDADLQNDPHDIPLLLQGLDEGLDVVCGWRWQRKDPSMKRYVSKGAALLRKFLIDDKIHDSGCTLRVYRAECFTEGGFGLYGEMHRFIPGILRWRGFNVGEKQVNHRPRIHGKTKYNWKRMLKGQVDMINLWFWRKYSARPIHMFGGLGFVMTALGGGFLIGLLVLRAFGMIRLADSIWPLLAALMILVGLQLFVAGIIADIAIRGYYASTNSVPYSVKEVIRR